MWRVVETSLKRPLSEGGRLEAFHTPAGAFDTTQHGRMRGGGGGEQRKAVLVVSSVHTSRQADR